MPLLSVRNLHVSYGAIQAVRGVSLDVEAGRIVTLIGANGAGKTTTLRTLSGMLRPDSGSIEFDGRPLAGVPPHEVVQRGMIHVPEGRGIFANLTVAENLTLGAYSRHDHEHARRARERGLELVPRLRERLQQNAGTLSSPFCSSLP